MAVPKKKTTPSRAGMRRAGHKLPHTAMSVCSNCKEFKVPHHVCQLCGHYRGRQVLIKKEKPAPEAADQAPAGA